MDKSTMEKLTARLSHDLAMACETAKLLRDNMAPRQLSEYDARVDAVVIMRKSEEQISPYAAASFNHAAEVTYYGVGLRTLCNLLNKLSGHYSTNVGACGDGKQKKS